jgi:integrase
MGQKSPIPIDLYLRVLDMKGRVKTKEKCPVCKKSFSEFKTFECPEHKTRPKKFFLWFYLPGYGKQKIYSQPNGKPITEYRDAVDLWAEINREIRQGTFDAKRYVRLAGEEYWVSSLLDRFLKMKSREIAPSYLTGYTTLCGRAREFFGKQYIREMAKIHILNYKEHLESLVHGKRLKDHLDHFRVFLNWAKEDLGIIDSVPDFPAVECEEPSIKWISQEDQAKIYEVIPDHAKPFFAFLFLHGCRPSEARALKCRDVDLDHRQVRIHATFSAEVYRPRRKGRGAKPVLLPIHPESFEYIQETVKGSLPEAWLFPNPMSGDHYRMTTVRKIWGRMRKRLKIGGLRLYDATRHSVASQLVNSGTPIHLISKILGHSSVKMTERYAHMNPEAVRVHLEKLSVHGAPKVLQIKSAVKK